MSLFGADLHQLSCYVCCTTTDFIMDKPAELDMMDMPSMFYVKNGSVNLDRNIRRMKKKRGERREIGVWLCWQISFKMEDHAYYFSMQKPNECKCTFSDIHYRHLTTTGHSDMSLEREE